MDSNDYYIDLKIPKAAAKYGWCLSNLVAFLRINLLVKLDLKNLLDNPFDKPPNPIHKSNFQYNLFAWGD